ncbi:MAG: cytochrome c [Sphingomicrobium sp.]
MRMAIFACQRPLRTLAQLLTFPSERASARWSGELIMRAMAVLALLLAAGCEGADSSKTSSATPEPPVTFDGAMVTEAAARLAHGERLTRVLGCRGCHGKALQGELWDDEPKGYGVTWASNLTTAIPAMTEAELRALLTKGVHPRRRDLWVMPSELFQHLQENDVAALVAYLRSMAPAGKPSPEPLLGPRAIAEIKSGKIKPAAALVPELKDRRPPDLGREHELGRYVTSVTCAECHGPQLKGVEGDTPDLIVAGGYSRAEFERLITQGVPTGNRKLKPLMQSVARSRFSQLTPNERDAVYAYLKRLAERPNDQD